MSVILSISSHVAFGHVGNAAAVFALERFGREVWAVPTVVLPFHPGHGPGTRIVPPPKDFAALLDDLARLKDIGSVCGILSGYLGGPDQADAIAATVDAVKRVNPDAVYCLDPVIGDHGALYVPEAVAQAIRDHLVPRADMITPNRFELAWLSGRETTSAADCVAAAEMLGVRETYVTSAPAMRRGNAAVLEVSDGAALLGEAPAVPDPPHGLGDLTAALLLHHRLAGLDPADRLRKTLASIHDLALQTARRGRDEMPLAAEQHRLLQSPVTVSITTLVTAPAR